MEYLVGQVIVGKSQVDYKSNCGNMTAAVGPYAVEDFKSGGCENRKTSSDRNLCGNSGNSGFWPD